MKDNYDLVKLTEGNKKKRVNSKRKGNNFQNKIAKKLNEKFNTKEFNSTPGSGAYATTHHIPEQLKIYGDLITPNGFRFCIEAKKGYNKINLSHLFNKKSDFYKFIAQAKVDANKSGKDWMVIFQQDRSPIYCIVDDVFFNEFRLPKISVNGVNIYLLDDIISVDNNYFMA